LTEARHLLVIRRAVEWLKPGMGLRLYSTSALVFVVGLGIGATWLDLALRQLLEHRVEHELAGLALAGKQVAEFLPSTEPHNLQRLAKSVASAASADVIVFDDPAAVSADPDVKHRTDQLLGGVSGCRNSMSGSSDVCMSRWRSHDVETEMISALVRVGNPGEHRVLCVSRSLDDVDVAMRQIRVVMGMLVVLGLVVFGLVGHLSARHVERSIRDLLSVVGGLVRVDSSRNAPASSDDEIEGLVGSISGMAREFRETVGALADERDRFGAVLEGMGEAVVAIDGDRRVTLCNRAAHRLLGWTESPVGKTLMEAIRHPGIHDLVRGATDGSHGVQEVEMETRNRGRLLASATRLSGVGGGVVLVLRDVTELRRLESVRRDFIANVSHELRTPVSTIRATAEALVDGALLDQEQGMRFSSAILRHAERLSRIIADLLDLSRIEAGEQVTDIQSVAVEAVARRALEVVADAACRRGLSLVIDMEPGLVVRADEDSLDHVVLNLLDNAVKYTTEGGQVIVRASTVGERVRLEVRDDGPGIPERHRGRIFERFFRVDGGRSRALGGTGLGLSIVRHLVETMGGIAGFEPNEPRGAVFWLELPTPLPRR